jgi:hypothetical protein
MRRANPRINLAIAPLLKRRANSLHETVHVVFVWTVFNFSRIVSVS